MKKRIIVTFLTFAVLIISFSGCKKDVYKLQEADFYGAWQTTVSETESRVMLYIENNTIYPDAAENDAIIIFVLTDTDTIIGFQGSFEIIDGYLKTTSSTSMFANEILQFSRKKFTLFTEASEDNQRIWRKTKSDWLTDNPLD